ncbi:transposase [Bacillus shivajii]|uniref:transposase n=1 Tax=Bacillus shivajii TaxID=1983719 RepID=UPI001CFB533A|nr:transposase [Bacillus shivajii]UCZ52208.1 transposase [Bacillus shivajii]
MKREKRIWNPNKYYHVMSRGIRNELFRNESDYQYFVDLIEFIHNKYKIEVVAYCLMKNHFHILIRTKTKSLSYVMRLLKWYYAQYFNKKYKLKGPVFETRFVSKQILDNRGLIICSRYIHFNPQKFVKDLETYKWSSYSYYLPTCDQPPDFLSTSPVLNQFPGTDQEKRKKYIEWCQY